MRTNDVTYHVTLMTNGRALSMSGAETIGEAVAGAFKDAAYYHAMGYPVEMSLEKHCRACGGCGDVPKGGRVRFARKPCPACRGDARELVFDGQKLPASESVVIVDPMQRAETGERLAVFMDGAVRQAHALATNGYTGETDIARWEAQAERCRETAEAYRSLAGEAVNA